MAETAETEFFRQNSVSLEYVGAASQPRSVNAGICLTFILKLAYAQRVLAHARLIYSSNNLLNFRLRYR